MKSFRTTTTIRATPAAIWALLTDAAGYPSWNPTVTRVAGRIAAGESITLHVRGSQRAFALKVVDWTPPQRMVWRGGMPLGLFTGQRTFTLTPTAGGDVGFEMVEDFTGALSGMITSKMPDLQPGFDEFAAALKARAESP